MEIINRDNPRILRSEAKENKRSPSNCLPKVIFEMMLLSCSFEISVLGGYSMMSRPKFSRSNTPVIISVFPLIRHMSFPKSQQRNDLGRRGTNPKVWNDEILAAEGTLMYNRFMHQFQCRAGPHWNWIQVVFRA
ncbi:hypothetical protein L2E82_01946 [Cichorium intybus]|uniref:Uncharacterized protein n=1 Tax=Cichorium intybus TaxID=13427 RepID=A0ACB9H0A8_CICIN|nr:hypothetical protein L2E82_01946 [Cichorium intybus]